MSEFDFQHEVLTHLGELRGEVKGIVARLDRLNGSVARHKEAIHHVRLDLNTHENDQKASMRTSVSWAKALWLVLSAAIGADLVTVIQAAVK